MISASKRSCGSKSQALALSDNDFNSSNFDSVGLVGVFLDAGGSGSSNNGERMWSCLPMFSISTIVELLVSDVPVNKDDKDDSDASECESPLLRGDAIEYEALTEWCRTGGDSLKSLSGRFRVCLRCGL